MSDRETTSVVFKVLPRIGQSSIISKYFINPLDFLVYSDKP